MALRWRGHEPGAKGLKPCWCSLGAHNDWEEHGGMVRREASLGEARKRGAGGWSDPRRKGMEKQKGFASLSKGSGGGGKP